MKEIELSDGTKIKVFPLTYGYLYDAETGVIKETKHGAIVNATDLAEDDIRDMRIHDVDKLYGTVLMMTYPDLYDEDGKLIPTDDEQVEDADKKKA